MTVQVVNQREKEWLISEKAYTCMFMYMVLTLLHQRKNSYTVKSVLGRHVKLGLYLPVLLCSDYLHPCALMPGGWRQVFRGSDHVLPW